MKVNGIINFYKPCGITSQKAVNIVKHLFGAEKAGHCGTLDPNAEGVLPIMLGNAVKLSEYLTEHDKFYTSELIPGVSTDSGDITGNILCDVRNEKLPSFDEIKKAAESFLGGYDQIPPMYSALKVGGVKLVNAARKGIEIERTPRHIDIYSINAFEENGRIYISVHCSRGTYIRTLCEDIGKKAGIPACMGTLKRTKVGEFGIESSVTEEELKNTPSEELMKYVIPVEKVLYSLPEVRLNRFFETLIRNGCAVDVHKVGAEGKSGEVRLYGTKGFFGIGEITINDGIVCIKHKKLFI